MLLHFKWICLILLKSVELCFDIKITFSFESFVEFYPSSIIFVIVFQEWYKQDPTFRICFKKNNSDSNQYFICSLFSSKKKMKKFDSNSKKKKKNDQPMRGLANTLSSKKNTFFTICNKSLFLNSFLCALVICLLFTFYLFSIHISCTKCVSFFVFENRHVFFRR